MKFFTRIAVLFYVTLVLFICCFLVLFIMQWLSFDEVFDYVYGFYFDHNLRLVLSVFTGLLLLMNYSFYRIFSLNNAKEKTIAFDNPSGRVRVSLPALEDLIRRQVGRMAEIKEVKLRILATRKGLLARVRLSLRSEGNIPEITTTVQDQVSKKLHDIIGLDESVNVAIYISKINPEQIKERIIKNPAKEEEKHDPNLPFQGYRA